MLLFCDLSTHDRPVRRVVLRILFPGTCQDGIDFGSIRNSNKPPGSLREVLGVNHSLIHVLPKLPSPLRVRINQSFVDSFAQVIRNTPCANFECRNCGGISPEGFASTAVKSFVWIMSLWVSSNFASG